MSGGIRKYGVCCAELIAENCVKIGRTLKGPRGTGEVDKKVIKEGIIPYIEKINVNYPIVIYDYWSKSPASKTGVDTIADGRGLRFRPRRPLSGSKRYLWLVDKNKIIELSNFKIVYE